MDFTYHCNYNGYWIPSYYNSCNNTTFDLLGIKPSVNLHEMPELNHKTIFLDIEQTIKQ